MMLVDNAVRILEDDTRWKGILFIHAGAAPSRESTPATA
jgi:hypothetical protein